MLINKIDETKQLNEVKDPYLDKPHGKVCIYDPQKICCAPRLSFKICRGCPRAAQYIRTNVVQNVFAKIRGLAILMMQSMGMGFDAGAGSSGGAGGAGGAGGSGGGGGGGGS